MGHSEYFSTLSKYQRPELSEEEKSLLFKIMNDVDITNQLSSYLRFRNRGTEEIDRMASPLVKTKPHRRAQRQTIERNTKVQT